MEKVLKVLQECKIVDQLRQKNNPKRTVFGIGKIVGLIIFLSYFTLLPAGLKYIWPYLLENFTQTVVYIGSVFAINVGIFLAYNCTLYIIYTIKHPFFQQYKNTDKPWPWQQNPIQWSILKSKSYKTLLINFFVVTPIMVYISIQTSLPYTFDLKLWPSHFQLIWQFVFFLLVQDVLFYFSHQLLHRPGWYWIHKQHHQYKQTISLAAHYVHPIQYVLSGTLPSSLGFQFLSFVTNVHYSTVLVWLIYRMIQSYEGHSGYTWTWNTLSLFPYTVGSDYHDFHHSMNDGNYGSVFIIWDALFNSERSFISELNNKVTKKEVKKLE